MSELKDLESWIEDVIYRWPNVTQLGMYSPHSIELLRNVGNQLEIAQHRIAELEYENTQLEENNFELGRECLENKAEIARRDKAAVDPVGEVMSNSWIDEDSRGEHFWVEWANNQSPAKGTKLYTAAQPAALPPEATEGNTSSHYSNSEAFAWVAGANWMRERVKALGAQPEVVIHGWPNPQRWDYPSERDYIGAVSMLRECEAVVADAGVRWKE